MSIPILISQRGSNLDNRGRRIKRRLVRAEPGPLDCDFCSTYNPPIIHYILLYNITFFCMEIIPGQPGPCYPGTCKNATSTMQQSSNHRSTASPYASRSGRRYINLGVVSLFSQTAVQSQPHSKIIMRAFTVLSIVAVPVVSVVAQS